VFVIHPSENNDPGIGVKAKEQPKASPDTSPPSLFPWHGSLLPPVSVTGRSGSRGRADSIHDAKSLHHVAFNILVQIHRFAIPGEH